MESSYQSGICLHVNKGALPKTSSNHFNLSHAEFLATLKTRMTSLSTWWEYELEEALGSWLVMRVESQQRAEH